MGASLLGIGASGLAAAQAGLATTGHNISNVNTPGFSRQEIVQSNRTPLFTGSGFMGEGVDVNTVRRVYSDFLATRAVMTQADASALAARSQQLSDLDGIFGDATTGLAPALSDFYQGFNALATTPADMTARQTALSGARALIGRFQELDNAVANLRDAANDRIRGVVTEINTTASQIAKLNARIAQVANSANAAQKPNDLLDQRDQLVKQLNSLVGATAVQQKDGSYNIFLSNGQALVVGEDVSTLVAQPDIFDAQDTGIALKTGASLLRLSSGDFSGGELAGVIAARDVDLTQTENELGRIAVGLASAFNAQHHLGQDMTGALGGDFFTIPAPRVQPSALNQGTGAVAATIVDPSALKASDYRIQYDGTGYTITELPNGTAQALPAAGLDGLTFTVSGAPQAGDTFVVSGTRYAARDLALAVTDTSRIAAAAPVRTAATSTNRGTGAISGGAVDANYLAGPLAAPVKLTYASATNSFSFTPASWPSVTYTAGASITFNGITFSMTGTPADGDTFTIGPNTNGTADNRNAQLLAATAQTKVLNGGTTTVASASAQLVGNIGSAAHQASVESDAQAGLLAHAQAAQSAVSGVNLDEEAANLQRYQLAYQASAKVMAMASSLFDIILDIAKT